MTGSLPGADRPGVLPLPARPLRPAVRVTLGQVAVGADHAANLRQAVAAVDAAAAAGSDLLVLPEYASGLDPRGPGAQDAEPLSGPFVQALRDRAAATGVAVIAGTTLPGASADRAVNAVVAVDGTGSLVGVYRKVHLYDAFGQRESDRLEPGSPDTPPVVLDVAGLSFGIMTCYDLRFPEMARRLVDAGAQVLVVPAAWAAGPRKPEHWRALAVARAIENTSVVVAVGQAGRGVIGRSLVVGPDGDVRLELGAVPGAGTTDLDPIALAAVRERNPSLANRRYAVVPREA
ncbi:carbon-nitrogen hydrolase family protein [Pengzhenrongella frigida]|uniref:Carbon-nitrogen hydrolase family protein n=1 Tax=Pengzhenrongella frigida TaxID=1259133 RepID=A0A4Q5N1S6_9MICO|nr:carbon-nitrogen hydrolase family protein [Cellulomonas sp. HLT2-17]RYV50497.1 carbon-nitrogen hydrolase family protein [Cellulomonas sp. HLT2-17]